MSMREAASGPEERRDREAGARPDSLTARERTGPDDLEVATGSGPLWLVEVQPEGRTRMPAGAWARGLAGDAAAGLGR